MKHHIHHWARHWKVAVLIFATITASLSLVADEPPDAATISSATTEVNDPPPYTVKTKGELRRTLTPMQFRVTQTEGTEPAFRNEYWNNKLPGHYDCIVCGMPLFSSETKFDSKTGWPSFFAPVSADRLGQKTDRKLGYPRTEVHCKRCQAHLGHVFDDGPAPTGLRFCMNSASLRFRQASNSQAPANPKSQ
jgi:methionine-R-sulfoxide reductase